MQDIIISLISSGGVASFFTWLLTRRRVGKKGELDNVEQAIKIWRQIAQDLQSEIDNLKKEVQQLTAELKKHQ